MGTTENTAAETAVRSMRSASAAQGGRTSNTGLSGSVGIGKANAPEDVMKVSGALAANGLMDAPQAHADSMLFKGIIGAQERMDSTLKRDGIVNPGGPTEQAFSRLAGQGFVKPVASPAITGTASSGQPATGDIVLNAKLRAQNKHDAVAAAEARIKANLSDDTRSDYRKAQDRNRLQKAREDADRADVRARHEQAERTRRLQEKRAAAAQKAANDARDDAMENHQRAERALNVLADKAGDMLGSVLGEMTRHSGADRNPVLPQAKAPDHAPNTDSIPAHAAAIARPAADPGSEDEKPAPDDPGQDGPEEPDETPDDPGQDDPEDPCAAYEQAVDEAEAEVETLEARADELEREIVDLADQVTGLEREKQQVLERLQGMTAVYVGAKLHPDAVVGEFNRALGMSDEEFYRQRKELLEKLKGAQQKLDPIRKIMHEASDKRRSLTPKIAYARGQLARAEAVLRRCEAE